MNTVLGEGSSSRLFQHVREEAGLAYDVHSFQTDYADTGTVQIYAGVAPSDMKATVKAILDELRRLRDEPIPMDELERARNYASGRLELKLEESRHVSAWLGVQEALHDRVLTLDEALAEVNEVTPEGIQAAGAGALHRRAAVHGGDRPAANHIRTGEGATHYERTNVDPDQARRRAAGADRQDRRALRGARSAHRGHEDGPRRPRARRAALRGPPRQAVLRGPGRVHHLGAAGRDGRGGSERGRGLPRDQRRDASSRGGAGLHPRRPGAGDGPQPRPRLGLAGERRDRAGAVVQARASCSTTAARSTSG